MLTSTEHALELVGLFQDAALEPGLWPQAYDRLAKTFDSPTGGLSLGTSDRKHLLLNILATDRPIPPGLEELIERYSDSDLRMVYGLAHPGEAFSCRQVLDGPAWEATPYYRNLLEPNGLAYTMCCMDGFDRHYIFGNATLRERGQPPYSEEEVRQFGLICPHIIRAVRTQIRLGMQQGICGDMRAALDMLATSVILVDDSLRIWFANRAAESILTARDGLTQSGGLLRGDGARQDARLESLILQTVQAARGGSLSPADSMTLSRPSGRRALTVLCVPLRADRLNTFPLRPTAMLFITDPEADRPVAESLIAHLYGLTSAEASLCGDLLRGHDLIEHAARRRVSVNTAKTHLKNVFAKTDTARQADLLRLILTSSIGLAVLDGLNTP